MSPQPWYITVAGKRYLVTKHIPSKQLAGFWKLEHVQTGAAAELHRTARGTLVFTIGEVTLTGPYVNFNPHRFQK